MRTKAILIGICVISVVSVGLGIYIGIGVRNAIDPPKSSANRLPDGVSTRVEVTKGQVTLIERGKPVQTLPVPKTTPLRIDIGEQSDIRIQKPSFLPNLCLLPHLGIAYSGRLEPLIGVQVLRSEPLRLGLSFNLTPSLLGISADYDVFDAGMAGIGIGTDWEANYRYYVYFGLHF